jgi:proline iminopeptidase
MNGPSEFNISGSFKDWDVTQRLAEITVPTLVLAGRHDELSPEAQADMARRIPGAEFEVFENGSHMAFWDDRDKFMKTMRGFLNRVDATLEDEPQIGV